MPDRVRGKVAAPSTWGNVTDDRAQFDTGEWLPASVEPVGPMPAEHRAAAYHAQQGRQVLTPAQQRRTRHKANRAARAAD